MGCFSDAWWTGDVLLGWLFPIRSPWCRLHVNLQRLGLLTGNARLVNSMLETRMNDQSGMQHLSVKAERTMHETFNCCGHHRQETCCLFMMWQKGIMFFVLFLPVNGYTCLRITISVENLTVMNPYSIQIGTRRFWWSKQFLFIGRANLKLYFLLHL